MKCLPLLLATAVLLSGCGDDESKPKAKASGKHLWSNQVEDLKTGRQTAKDLQDSLKLQEKRLQEARR